MDIHAYRLWSCYENWYTIYWENIYFILAGWRIWKNDGLVQDFGESSATYHKFNSYCMNFYNIWAHAMHFPIIIVANKGTSLQI